MYHMYHVSCRPNCDVSCCIMSPNYMMVMWWYRTQWMSPAANWREPAPQILWPGLKLKCKHKHSMIQTEGLLGFFSGSQHCFPWFILFLYMEHNSMLDLCSSWSINTQALIWCFDALVTSLRSAALASPDSWQPGIVISFLLIPAFAVPTSVKWRRDQMTQIQIEQVV